MALKDFEIRSMSDLQNDLLTLRGMSDNINSILNKINTTYENQKEGYDSANSAKLAYTMQECARKAKKISDNITTIEQSVEGYRRQIAETDEA